MSTNNIASSSSSSFLFQDTTWSRTPEGTTWAAAVCGIHCTNARTQGHVCTHGVYQARTHARNDDTKAIAAVARTMWCDTGGMTARRRSSPALGARTAPNRLPGSETDGSSSTCFVHGVASSRGELLAGVTPPHHSTPPKTRTHTRKHTRKHTTLEAARRRRPSATDRPAVRQQPGGRPSLTRVRSERFACAESSDRCGRCGPERTPLPARRSPSFQTPALTPTATTSTPTTPHCRCHCRHSRNWLTLTQSRRPPTNEAHIIRSHRGHRM